jgi:hypothetical protein
MINFSKFKSLFHNENKKLMNSVEEKFIKKENTIKSRIVSKKLNLFFFEILFFQSIN